MSEIPAGYDPVWVSELKDVVQMAMDDLHYGADTPRIEDPDLLAVAIPAHQEIDVAEHVARRLLEQMSSEAFIYALLQDYAPSSDTGNDLEDEDDELDEVWVSRKAAAQRIAQAMGGWAATGDTGHPAS